MALFSIALVLIACVLHLVLGYLVLSSIAFSADYGVGLSKSFSGMTQSSALSGR